MHKKAQEKLGDNYAKPKEEMTRVEKIVKAVKEFWPVKKIAEAISSLKKKYEDLKTKIQNTAPGKRSIFQKVMNLIVSAIDKFSGWISKKNDNTNKEESKTA